MGLERIPIGLESMSNTAGGSMCQYVHMGSTVGLGGRDNVAFAMLVRYRNLPPSIHGQYCSSKI